MSCRAIPLLLCFMGFLVVKGQDSQPESIEDIFKVDYDSPLTLDLTTQEEAGIEPVRQKKKKVKKNVFFGIKTRKRHTRALIRGSVVYELFHTMKVYEAPPDYARDFYWFDDKKKKIVNSLKVNAGNATVLHGPYKQMIGDVVLEEGWFYKGMKHKRWVRFNKYDILQNKTYWWKGWPQESLLTYYDFKKTQLKEVIPMHYGERKGEYWAFHENGRVAVKGRYKFNHKVGTWREYYDGRRVKREVKYSDDPFNFEFRPYIVKEWDVAGKVLYDKVKFERSKK